MEDMPISTLMGIAGFVIGLGFGALTHRTNFCTMGAISDAVAFGDMRRARAWLLAIAVTMIGAQTMHFMGMIDLGESIYLGTNINLVGAVIGGLIFGFGMVIASGCPGRNLARAGGGDLKALVVLIFIGLFGYMALRGIVGPVRAFLQNDLAIDISGSGLNDQGLGSLVAAVIGTTVEMAGLITGLVIAAALLWYCFKDAEFRSSKQYVVAGIGVGLLAVAGWWATGVLGADDFEPAPLVSLTFIAPIANSLQYLMTYTGSTINFGIATVGGAILGAFLSAKLSGKFILITFFDTADTLRNMSGGALMGMGGVLALGCTIGQGITGVSTLSITSFVAIAAIVVGGIAGIKYQERALGL